MTTKRFSIAELQSENNINKIKNIFEIINPEHNDIEVQIENNSNITYINLKVNSTVGMYAELNINVLDESVSFDIIINKDGEIEQLKHKDIDRTGSAEDILNHIEDIVKRAYREYIE